jgi:hypothetical protein
MLKRLKKPEQPLMQNLVKNKDMQKKKQNVN